MAVCWSLPWQLPGLKHPQFEMYLRDTFPPEDFGWFLIFKTDAMDFNRAEVKILFSHCFGFRHIFLMNDIIPNQDMFDFSQDINCVF